MTNQPIIIFGTGGSGTRVVAKIIQETGCFLGSNLNYALDSLDIAQFLDKWANAYLILSQWLNAPAIIRPYIASNIEIYNFNNAILKHKARIPNSNCEWGIKSPRSIYVLPIFHHYYPQMKAIHVIRNGLDMAYSSNQNQLDIHGKYILDKDQINELSIQELSIALWSKVNLAAAKYGGKYLGDRYLRIEFEDLCRRPDYMIERICRLANVSMSPSYKDIITRPNTIRRWTKENQEEIKKLIVIGKEGLEKFEYLQK